jgi:uncharacterized protein (TIGR02145 family)
MKAKLFLFIIVFLSNLELHAQTTMNIHQSNGNILQISLNTIDSITYTISNPGNLATLTTLAVSSITSNNAITGGNITSDGGTLITQRGVCISKNPLPTTANTKIINGSGIGSYNSSLTGLTANTTYYLRAFAINSAGTAYGNEVSFTTTSSGAGIISNPGAGVTYNGYTYKSIVLGNGQEWMAENLRTNSYANGDPIPNITDATQWSNLTTGAWVHYNNDSQYENPYGKLYNWFSVVDTRKLCPIGWHVPSDEEWTILINYLGGTSIAGGKLKSIGTQNWQTPNYGATDEIGFSALPGSTRFNDGTFYPYRFYSLWWSSTQNLTNDAWYIELTYNWHNVNKDFKSKKDGVSIRCLKD